MEYRGRRGRRIRLQNVDLNQANTTRSNLLGGLMNLAATAAVAYVVIMMLQDSGQSHSKQEINKLVDSINYVAKQLDTVKNNYQILENQVSVYSQELPKLEQQMAALEALSQIIEASRQPSHLKVHCSPTYLHATVKKFNKTMQSNPINTKTKSALTI